MSAGIVRIGCVVGLALALCVAGVAQADWGFLGNLIGGGPALSPGYPGYDFSVNPFRGSEFIGNPNYYNSPQGGPLFDNNIFRQRLQRNRLGGGWTFEEFRFFGTDSYDNPNTFDFGALKVQLGRDPTIVGSPQPVGIHNKIGYTTTLIPEIVAESQTGQRNFDQFSGQTSFTPVPINYRVNFNSGVQDFEWNGNAFLDADARINILGFYDFNLRFTNVGNYTADGVLYTDEQVTDLDTGQVRLSGNLVMDAIAGVFQAIPGPLGELNTIFPRVASGASQKTKQADELMQRLRNGETLTDDEMNYLVQQMFLTAFQSDPLGFIRDGMPETVPGFEGLDLSSASQDQSASEASVAEGTAAASGDGSLAPEPGTAMLVLLVGAGLSAARSFSPRSRSRSC